MTEISKLVDEYKKTEGWKKEKELLENTKEAVYLLISGIVESTGKIGTEELETIFQMCQNVDTVPADDKKEKVEDLEIDADKTEKIKSLIEKDVGVVGKAPSIHMMDIPPGKEKKVYEFIQAIREEENKDEIDEAINNFGDLDIEQIQSGTVSPILYFLHPKKYPINNGKSRENMKKYFDMEISRRLTDYTADTEKYREVREKYGFDEDYRDLDKFMIWLSEEIDDKVNIWQLSVGHSKREKMWETFSEEGVAAIGFSGLNYQGLSKDEIEERRREIGKDTIDRKKGSIYDFYNKVKRGDIIIAKTGRGSKKPYGIGIVEREAYYDPKKAEDLFPKKTDEYASFIDVDWKIDFVEKFDERPKLDLKTGFATGALKKYDEMNDLINKSVKKSDDLSDLFKEVELTSKKLKLEPKIWLEKTERDNKSSHDGWTLGECLASPQRNSRGADIYRYMRDCREDDVVIHYLQDEDKLVGISKVSAPYEEIDNPPQDMNSRWEGRPGYRVPLKNYKKLDSPILIRNILENDDYKQILKAINKTKIENIKLFYDKYLGIMQGRYLTKIPAVILKIFMDRSSELERYFQAETDYSLDNLERIDLEVWRESLTEEEKKEEGKITLWDDVQSDLKIKLEESRPETGKGLHFPEDQWDKIKDRIHYSLKKGKHLIILGPPGTGKSKLAKKICSSYRSSDKKWKMSTATSDWTTFDTIGGYRMEKEGDIEFNPGLFLECFHDEKDRPRNIWLIIDEINRADIDKAFGSLFSALTGDNIFLPYKTENGETIKVIGNISEKTEVTSANYIIPEDWRIIATMNTFDKASLYEMSYAFMRRFAFIKVGIPKNIHNELIKNYIDCWDEVEEDNDLIENVKNLWECINETRPVGPALVKDIYTYLFSNREDFEGALTQYVYPQFEGISRSKHIDFINKIHDKVDEIDDTDKQNLIDFVEDFFRIEISEDEI